MLTDKEIENFAEQLPPKMKVIDMREGSTDEIWTFVEKFYPDYYSCPEIAYNNDLERIVEGDPLEEDSSSYEVYKDIAVGLNVSYNQSNECVKGIVVAEAETLLQKSNSEIYERAIQGFLDIFKS